MVEMVTLRMVIELSGTRSGVSWPPIGGLVELPVNEAEVFLRNRWAIKVDKPKHEAAPVEVEGPVETAAMVDDSEKRKASGPGSGARR